MQNDFVSASTQLIEVLQSGQVLPVDSVQFELDSFAFKCALAEPQQLEAIAPQIAAIQQVAGEEYPALRVPPLPTPGSGQMG